MHVSELASNIFSSYEYAAYEEMMMTSAMKIMSRNTISALRLSAFASNMTKKTTTKTKPTTP